MKRKIFVLAVAVSLVLVLAGCSSMKEGLWDSGVTTNLETKKYEILGPVTLDGKVTNICFFWTFGGKGYSELMEEAKRLYPEADAVIDIYVDNNASTILGVYNKFGKSYYGTAIKYL